MKGVILNRHRLFLFGFRFGWVRLWCWKCQCSNIFIRSLFRRPLIMASSLRRTTQKSVTDSKTSLVIANMFYIPLGIMFHTESLSVDLYIRKWESSVVLFSLPHPLTQIPNRNLSWKHCRCLHRLGSRCVFLHLECRSWGQRTARHWRSTTHKRRMTGVEGSVKMNIFCQLTVASSATTFVNYLSRMSGH